MRLLLDTQIIYRWLIEPERMWPLARRLVHDSADAIFVSRVSLWEMAIKVGAGKMTVDLSKFALQVARDGFVWLPIEESHLLRVASLPRFDDHKDPFDRMLIAQSLTEPLILLTTDRKLAQYGSTVQVIA
jgi:PIN domain nuclease of toxin-antitoxin system